MMNFLKVLIFIPIILIASCKTPWKSDDKSETNYRNAWFNDTPTNAYDLNTEFDDFNPVPIYLPLVPPYENTDITESFILYFSTNRTHNGTDFDIVRYKCSIIEADTVLTLTAQSDVCPSLEKINTLNNEYGPYLISINAMGIEHESTQNYVLFLYANDRNGNLDIFYVKAEEDFSFEEAGWELSNPQESLPVTILDSDYDDAYPTVDSTRNELLFSSNRDQSYDIYKIPIPQDIDLADFEIWLQSEEISEILKVAILNSISEDRCPYINGDLLVFTSNREGGYGGFDLWYSIYDNNEWSEPVNFGPKINSEFNEYRPIVLRTAYYMNDLLIFSSDRPGGKGGFDIYYVGIEKMTGLY